ncbi:hypothetical protein TorRG33x02_001570 [Trema orientale]|uniref:Uncharacterized protein n=1 Tax=Trema orientale TaxID=63057 RepID=A0A2P5G1C3_TREOI|nr:hypothetical protein TorRG33x02_001570 [Trema orientale]
MAKHRLRNRVEKPTHKRLICTMPEDIPMIDLPWVIWIQTTNGMVDITSRARHGAEEVPIKTMSANSMKHLGPPKGVVMTLKYQGEWLKRLKQRKRKGMWGWSWRSRRRGNWSGTDGGGNGTGITGGCRGGRGHRCESYGSDTKSNKLRNIFVLIMTTSRRH